MLNKMLNSNVIQIVVNDVAYNLHKDFLETMEIFQLLSDCETDIIPPIKWDISSKNVIKAFEIAKGKYLTINSSDSLSEHIEIIKFLRYLLASSNIINECIGHMIGGSIINYLNKCDGIPYDDTMLFILDTNSCWKLTENPTEIRENFRTLMDKIIGSQFPIDFQKKVIMKFTTPVCPMLQKNQKRRTNIPSSVKSLDLSYIRQQ